MHRTLRTFLPAIAILLLLASCQSLPKHARYIPKDALVVLGVHTGEMQKALAWSAITGSSLLDEMRKAGGEKAPAMLKDAENAGIDFRSTLYFYSKPDTRFSNEARMAAVLPVSDAKKVTAYIQKHAPDAVIRTVKDRSEVMIDGKAYIGWNDEVLIAMNTIVQKTAQNPAPPDATSPDQEPAAPVYAEPVVDAAATAMEMDAAFNPAKDAGMTDNSRFKELENNGHDITMWLAYDALMDAYSGKSGMGMMGFGMGNALWKGSAMAAGFDFEKGRFDGEMRYYASDSMQSVAKEFGSKNVDADMLRRLPAAGLNFAAGYHLAPKAIRMVLDKMGMTGMANLALMQKGMSIDDILGAFTGDMVVSLNNFRVETKLQEIDSVTQKEYGLTPAPVSSPEMDFVYAMKIADKAKMTKLLDFITSSAMLQQTAPGVYSLPNTADGPTLVVGDKYLAISKQAPWAQAFLKESPGTMPEAVKKEIDGHPLGMWADVQSFMAGAGQSPRKNPSDSAAFHAVRNLFTTFTGHGGEYKGNASVYHMSLGFVNKDENSLVQLLHLAQQLAASNNRQEVAQR